MSMSMPTTQVRIRNKEGVVLTKNGTYLTHIEMDNVGQSDFSRSYLDLQLVFKDGMGEIVRGKPVYMGDSVTQKYYDGQAIIRNARLTCDAFGILEENIKINVLHQTMEVFLKNQQEKQSEQVYGNEVVNTDVNTGIAHILVPLSSFLGSGTQIYDHERLGNSTIRLELEFQKDIFFFNPDETGAYINVPCDDVTAGAEDEDVTTIESVTRFHSLMELEETFSVGNTYTVYFDDEGGNPDSVNAVLESLSWNATTGYATFTFETTLFVVPAGETYDNVELEDNTAVEITEAINEQAGTSVSSIGIAGGDADDFIVGDFYDVGWFFDDVSGTNVQMWYVSSGQLKSAVSAAGVLTLTFQQPIINIPTEHGTGLVQITTGWIRLQAYDPLTWEVQQIDLVLHKLLKPMKTGKMVYETYSLEQTNQPEALSYRKQFYTEPNAYKFVYLTPTTNLISEINNANSFRISLNNIDLTNRDIPLNQLTNGSLYNDRLVMNVDGLKSVQLEPQDQHQTIIYCDRCPLGQTNMVEFRIDSDLIVPMDDCVGHFFKYLQREV